MSTQLFFTNDETDDFTTFGNTKLSGGTIGSWRALALLTARGGGVVSAATALPTGPTNGAEVGPTAGGQYEFLTPPLAAAVTISGSITWNLRGLESNMAANAAINAIIEKVDGATHVTTLIHKTVRTVELGTAETAENFAETPAAGIACKKGDRIRVRVFADDAAGVNTASGNSFTFFYNGTTSGASGDSFFTLTENLTFLTTAPTGTQVFLTDGASAVATADIDYEAWTSRGAGVVSKITGTVNGPTAPIQATDTDGGTAISWFTKALQAVTLSDLVEVNIRGSEEIATTNASIGCEIAVVAGDGTSPTVWAKGLICRTAANSAELATTETVYNGYLSGDDLAITAGQRIRIRLFFDDAGQNVVMIALSTATTYISGTSGGASGDAYLKFTQTLAESGGGGAAASIVLRQNRQCHLRRR